LTTVVVKIPRWTFEKFPGAQDFLTTSMKSVGEVMAIGRTFKEALQKGVRSLEISRFGLGYDGKDLPDLPPDELRAKLITPNSQRLFYLLQALRDGLSVEEIFELTKIDPWFLHQIKDLVEFSEELATFGRLLRQGRGQEQVADMLRRAKEHGFSDRQLAHLWGGGQEEYAAELRGGYGIKPVYKLVDTCAAEFEAYTPYYYSTYEYEVRGPAHRGTRWRSWGAAPTASARASSSTIAAARPPLPCGKWASNPSW
jgi:carbamoyl-phosphate synthase large subunit